MQLRLQTVIQQLSKLTILLLPALTMWVPIGAEVWLLLVLICMLLAYLFGWRSGTDAWSANQKFIAVALVGIITIKTLSVLWSIAPELTWRHVRMHLHLLLFLPLLVLFGEVKGAQQLFFRRALPLSVGLGAVLGLFAWAKSGFAMNGFEFAGATKNSLILALLVTYAVSGLLSDYLDRRQKLTLFWLFCAIIIVFMGGKRSTILVIFSVITFSLWLNAKWARNDNREKSENSKYKWMDVFSICLLLVVLVGFTWKKWVLLYQEAYTFFNSGFMGGSIDTRLELYSIAWNNFIQNPWLGVGAGTARKVIEINNLDGLNYYNHFHQFGLQSLSDIGLWGTFILVFCLVLIQKSLNSASRLQPLATRLSAANLLLIAILFGFVNLSFGNILFHIIFSYLLAITVSAKNH